MCTSWHNDFVCNVYVAYVYMYIHMSSTTATNVTYTWHTVRPVSVKPHCFINVNMSALLVHHYSLKNPQVDKAIFSDWRTLFLKRRDIVHPESF